MSTEYDHDHENEVTLFGETNFRNERRRFGIKTDDRRRHMYVIGKTGMGKTTLLENLILNDINNGHGCCYIDPHGDTAESLLEYIPSNRINDVVYFNPADADYPVGFNILETQSEEQKPLIASGLMGVFKKIWPDVWSARMEYILMNCVLALLDYPGATLLGINRILVDKDYRARVVAKIRDPIVKTFWVAEFAGWSEKYATEAIAPVQNKVGQFLSSSIIRNMVAQVKSSVNLRNIMDDGKILIVNLSKGRIGEDNMRLLGGMLITKMQLAAQERQNVLESERRDFYLFVDEFQNFSNESFASILSEARKFRLNLIVTHQYVEQLEEEVAAAIFGNIGTLIVMRVGAADAEKIEPEFAPTFTLEDLLNLAKYQMYLKLMVDGVATPGFSANTLPPISGKTGNKEKVIAVSRERYAEPKSSIEEKVLRWSGMEAVGAPIAHAPESTGEAPSADWEVASEVIEAKPEAVNLPEAIEPGSHLIDEAARELQGLMAPAKTEEAPAAPEPVPTEKPEAPRMAAVAIPVENLEGVEEKEEEYLRIIPERLAAIQESVKARSSSKPKFIHKCSRCGKTWELAIKLDPTRPMYCPECRPIVLEERKDKGKQLKRVKRTLPPPEGAEQQLVEGSFASKNLGPVEPHKSNKPRLVVPEGAPSIHELLRDEEDEDEDLLAAILKTKERPVELRKKELEKKAGETGTRDARRETRTGAPQHGETRDRGAEQGAAEATKKRKRRRKKKTSNDQEPRPEPARKQPDIGADLDLGFDESPKSDHETPAASGKRVAPGEKITFE
jgi:hypothetical protein